MSEPAFKKFPTYRKSLDFYTEALAIIESLPKGNAEIADQLKRASQSISLNIAEGAGKYRPRDKSRYYLSASGSAHECCAALDLLLCEKLVSVEEHARLSSDLASIAGGLVMLAKAVVG